MAVGAFLGETNPGHAIEVKYEPDVGRLMFRVGDEEPYYVFFKPNNSFSDALQQIGSEDDGFTRYEGD